MRVLVLSWNSILDEGNFGVRAVRKYADWLAKAGHEVVLFSGAQASGYPGYSLPDLIKKNGVIGGGRFLPQSLMVAMFPVGDWRAQVLCTSTHGPVTAVDQRAFESHTQRIIRDLRPHLTICMALPDAVQGALRLVRQAGCPVLGLVDSVGLTKEAFRHTSRVLCLSQELSGHYGQSLGMRSAGFPAPSGTAPDVQVGQDIVIMDPDRDDFYADLVEPLSTIAPVRVCSTADHETNLHPRTDLPLSARLGILLQSPDIRQAWGESFAKAGVPLITVQTVVQHNGNPDSWQGWIDAWFKSAKLVLNDHVQEESLVNAQRSLFQSLCNPDVQKSAYIRLAEAMTQQGSPKTI